MPVQIYITHRTCVPCSALAAQLIHTISESHSSTPEGVYSLTTTIMSIPTFIFNGGGGGGGHSPSLGSGKNNNQDIGTGTTNSGQHSMLLTRRERVNIDLIPNFTGDEGHITIAPGARIPERLVLTARGGHRGTPPINTFSFILDVLLVPIHHNMETCHDLYLDPFIPEPGNWHIGISSLRDNIILLRRMVVRGAPDALAAEQWDIQEDLRNRIDYRLVVTCPMLHWAGEAHDVSILLLLEMEF
ncbi:hypothetical protein BC827DRAFT_511707 [Russula dissimulans]|nr:hypothetical protein BC827DRAFT_511707 [Russula dissimulans]